MVTLLFLLNFYFFKLDFSEGILSLVSLPYFSLISGNAPLLICFALISKNMVTNFTISFTYYQNFVSKIVAKILFLFSLVLSDLIAI